MAIRTTYVEVVKLVEVDATISTDLIPFITTASSMVDDCCLNSGYSAPKLELIERWLAAHIYTIRDNRISSEGVKGITQSFSQSVGLGLKSSMQGQMAMMIDTAGNLSALSSRMEKGRSGKLRVVALGDESLPTDTSEYDGYINV